MIKVIILPLILAAGMITSLHPEPQDPSATPKPDTDLYEEDNNIIVRMPLPGIDPDTIDITIENKTLRVSGKTAQPEFGAPAEPGAPTEDAAPIKLVPVEQTVPEEVKDIYLNFENTELSSFIDYIAELKKLNIIPEKTLEGSKISLTIREPLSVTGVWNIFLTILEMAGFSIVKTGEVYKIITKDKKLTQALPAYVNVPYQSLPDSDITIRYVTFLTNLTPSSVEPILASMLSATSMLHKQDDMNAFIITDKSYNIKAAVKLISELDQMGLPESVVVLRLKRVNAIDTKQLLEALIKKPDGSPLARLLGKTAEGGTEYFSPTTRIIAEERSNSLILLGNSKSIEKVIDFITNNIDTEIKEAKSPLHIYELQHIDAGQVRDILKEVTATPDSATGAAAGKFGSIRGGVKYFKPITFQVDKDGNRLIVSCTDKQDWKLLKRTIQDLDKPQPQVALEALLVTVSAEDVKGLGGMVRNKKHGQIGKNIDFQSASLTSQASLESGNPPPGGPPAISLLGNLLNQLVAAQGKSVLTFGSTAPLIPGSQFGVWGVFEVLKKETNASIISEPSLTVANKTTANITVGSTQRIKSQDVVNSGGSTVTSGYVDANAATKIDVTPQINLDGVIRLKVRVEITDFTDPTGNNKTSNIVDTNVTVADGQVLILGGFVQTKVTESKSKTPILGDIPVVGWFFKNQSRDITKQYIFVFLSPTIIKPRTEPGMQLYTKMKLHQATDDIENAIETKRTLDPIHNWFFNSEKENYSHKVIDYANARYQPTTVDIKNDPYYRSRVKNEDYDAAASLPKDAPDIEISEQEGLIPLAETLPLPAELTPAIMEEEPDLLPVNAPKKTPEATPVQAPTPEPVPTPAPTPTPARTPLQTPLPRSSLSRTRSLEGQAQESSADDTLTQQRQKLKMLLATPAMPCEPATVKPASRNPEQPFVIDPQKRNTLKQFLSTLPERKV